MRRTFAALAVLIFSATAFAAATPGEILAANKLAAGGAAWDGLAVLRLEQDYAGQGLTGTVITLIDLKTGWNTVTHRIGPSEGVYGYSGTVPWERDSAGLITEQAGGDDIAIAVNDAYRLSNQWWRDDFGGAAVESGGAITDSTGRYDVLRFTPKGGLPFEAWFDAATHLLVRIVERQGAQIVSVTQSDHTRFGAIVLARQVVIDNGQGGKYVHRMTTTAVTVLASLPASAFAPPKYQANDWSIAKDAASTTIPIRIVNNHIYGEAKVNGKGPFLFVFDTGGSDVVTPPIAKQLGLKVEGELAGTGAGTGVMETGFSNGLTLTIGDASLTNQQFLVMGLDKFGEIEGVPMPGMVGYEAFRRFVTRIDYGAATLTLIDPAKFDPADAGTPVPFVFNDRVPEVMGTIEGIPAKLDIDTGSRAELTVTKPFSEANQLRARHPKGIDAVAGWGVGGPSTGYVTRLSAMTIGSVDIGPVVATLADQDKGAFADGAYSGNVGGGLLKRFIVTFDYTRKVMYLKPLSVPVRDTGSYDRAGLWLNLSGNGFVAVAVTKGGPAEKAGLKVGDRILAVDGADATQLSLSDLRLMLRSAKPGTPVVFTVYRGSKTKRIKVVLRDLI